MLPVGQWRPGPTSTCYLNLGDISGSHDVEYEDDYLTFGMFPLTVWYRKYHSRFLYQLVFGEQCACKLWWSYFRKSISLSGIF